MTITKLNIKYTADKWTEEEMQILIEFFPKEGVKSFSRITGRTKSSCQHKVVRLGLMCDNIDKF